MPNQYYTISYYIQTNEDWHECHDECFSYHIDDQYVFSEEEYREHMLAQAHQIINKFSIAEKYANNEKTLTELHRIIDERFSSNYFLIEGKEPILVQLNLNQGGSFNLKFDIGFNRSNFLSTRSSKAYYEFIRNSWISYK